MLKFCDKMEKLFDVIEGSSFFNIGKKMFCLSFVCGNIYLKGGKKKVSYVMK